MTSTTVTPTNTDTLHFSSLILGGLSFGTSLRFSFMATTAETSTSGQRLANSCRGFGRRNEKSGSPPRRDRLRLWWHSESNICRWIVRAHPHSRQQAGQYSHVWGVVRKEWSCSVGFFPNGQRYAVAVQHVHVDPEFDAFTYGDPTSPIRSLRTLERADVFIFYCGLQNWDEGTGWRVSPPSALYIVGYFVVELAGMAADFSKTTLRREFGQNFHFRYPPNRLREAAG